MALTIQVFTLNCGNGSAGQQTVQQIIDSFMASDGDLLFLNCQEVNFDLLEEELRAAGSGFLYAFGPKMVTHTKLATAIHCQTGINILVIYKSELNVRIDQSHSQLTRRNHQRLAGSNYNKGGLITRVLATKDNENYVIDSLCGHLDAFYATLRATDWANLHRLLKHVANSWEELIQLIPDFFCSGIDVNTRNKLSYDLNGVTSHEAWNWPLEPEIQNLIMAPLGNYRLSTSSTYKTTEDYILTRADPKRKGYAKGGMLDIVAYNNKAEARKQLAVNYYPLVDEINSFNFPPESGEKRDHAIIGSPLITLSLQNPFEKIRVFIGCALVYAAPELSRYLLNDEFIETETNKDYLLHIYQTYLAPEGLLQKKLQLHAAKLDYTAQLKKTDSSLQKEIETALFYPKPWFCISAAIPKTVNELTTVIHHHTALLKAETLLLQFLREATSEVERDNVLAIVNNAWSTEPQDLSWARQVKKLLLFNQALQQYSQHLGRENRLSEEQEEEDLLHQKRKLIEEFSHMLVSGKQQRPEDITAAFNKKLTGEATRTALSTHRNDTFLYLLFRTLMAIFSDNYKKSKGAFFIQRIEQICTGFSDEPQHDYEKKNDCSI
ncbi:MULTISPECIES: hypothetical protein [unclassified Legionella]|uniref:hypothetical protein n=1 Tax=unclassified Legionella TaxID=2622702 RepID=UPI001054C6BD|nr:MULTISPECIES: hypothetical protein [unclassified Legionella]MDI9819787.1 hypothetical protein [Legionella sp. PL877]